jgi:hypothetical protein
MTAKAHISSKHDPGDRRWTVEVSLKVKPEELRLDVGVVADVIRLWLADTAPEAVVVEAEGTPIRHVQVPTRAQARRLVKVWGGRIVTTPTSGFTQPLCPGNDRRHAP